MEHETGVPPLNQIAAFSSDDIIKSFYFCSYQRPSAALMHACWHILRMRDIRRAEFKIQAGYCLCAC